jgi:hypothetical protein
VDKPSRRRNAALLAELGKAIIADASILEGIPEGAMLVLLPADADPEFIEAGIATGIEMIGKGHNVYFRHLAPGEWGIDFVTTAGQEVATSGDRNDP